MTELSEQQIQKVKIGIDTGVSTGVAVSINGVLERVECMTITQAMNLVCEYPKEKTTLYIEDARLWIGFHGKTKKSDKRLQGAGSVKRDARVWEDWCAETGYSAYFIKPMGKGLKKSADEFKRITGWQGRTNEHARDAALIVFGR